MWVVFQKSDGKIVGISPDSPADFPKKAALEEIVRGLVERKGLAQYDAVQVADRVEVLAVSNAFSAGHAFVRTDSRGEQRLVDETPEVAALVVSTDATAAHPVDGVPLIAGDGESFLTITVAKVDAQGKALERKKDNDTLWLRTDHGTLRDGQGKEEIRSLKLASGKAAFRFYSERAKRLATVQIFNGDPYLRDTAVRVELI